MTRPVHCTWDGEVFAPLQRMRKYCDETFVVGLTYPLVIEEERSRASHGHYFASITEAWRNLPEAIAANFPTAEHLRKYVLIKAGFYDELTYACINDAEARRLAAFLRPLDDYAIITVEETVVRRFTAKSQSIKTMKKDEFQRSKNAVLEIVANMIDVQPSELQANAGRAA